MSLTSFLKNKDVKDAFKQEFKMPAVKFQADLLAPPLTNHYGLVGTAFDYLLRFHMKSLNPKAIEKRWVSESSLSLLKTAEMSNSFEIPADTPIKQKLKEKITENTALSDPAVYRKVENVIQGARKVYSEFIKNRTMGYDLFKVAILLAQVDVIYRAGIVDENLGKADEGDLKDLRNLISLVKPEQFRAKEICLLNPTFGEASQLVGGADCDLVIDETLIDIKTTKKLELTRDYLNQLIGYYILYKIGGVDSMPSKHEIKRLGVYFSRHAYLFTIDVRDVIRQDTFLNFVAWFKKRAGEKYEI